MSDDNITLEERFTKLEEIVKKMEDPDVSLDESFESVSYTHLTLPTKA